MLRWSGALAKSLRGHNIALSGKHSGSANTDALTLADLTIQELIVAALRDADPVLRTCRIEAEETTGDLSAVRERGRPRAGDRSDRRHETVPRPDGQRLRRDAPSAQSRDRALLAGVCPRVRCARERGSKFTTAASGRPRRCRAAGPRRARRIETGRARPLPESKKIYVIGFQDRDPERARDLASVGLEGHTSETMAGSIYELMARGEYGGSLIHSPNVYDFPVSLHIARALGGDAVWVRDRRPVHFGETWLDDRANMIRLPGIVACSPWPATLDRLCKLARDWNPNRYPPEDQPPSLSKPTLQLRAQRGYALRLKTMIVMSSFCARPLAWARTSARSALPISAALPVLLRRNSRTRLSPYKIALRVHRLAHAVGVEQHRLAGLRSAGTSTSYG